jgi:LPS sulfotransferase NodH
MVEKIANFQTYVVATSPRSGSTLLCRMLAETGVAGVPESYFHTPSLDVWLDEYGLRRSDFASDQEAVRAVFTTAMALGSGETSLFGLRLQRPSFNFLMQKLKVLYPEIYSDKERFEAAFGRVRFVHLARADKVEQAVSMLRAEQTGLWHRHADGREMERLSPSAEPMYDCGAIARKVEDLSRYDQDWLDWFASEGMTPLRVVYEDLAAEPLRVLRDVLTDLGCDPEAALDVEPATAKLADAVSADWVARFRRETAV